MQKINIFDFDGTLSTDTWPKFWVWAEKFGFDGSHRNETLEAALSDYRSNHEGDHLETFFGFFDDLLKESHTVLTQAELMEGERYIVYNPGVETFIKKSGARNYIVSGGLVDFLGNLKLAPYFDGIYGTPVEKNATGGIIGIGKIMTNAKKIEAIKDILARNGRDADDCRGVSYVGDGYSDADSMEYVHNHGGKAIFVHQPDNTDEFAAVHNATVFAELKNLGVVDYNLVADYRPGTKLYNILG